MEFATPFKNVSHQLRELGTLFSFVSLWKSRDDHCWEWPICWQDPHPQLVYHGQYWSKFHRIKLLILEVSQGGLIIISIAYAQRIGIVILVKCSADVQRMLVIEIFPVEALRLVCGIDFIVLIGAALYFLDLLKFEYFLLTLPM